MKKAVLIPDSFKGTISSKRICEIIENKIYDYYPDCEVISIPVADGGEGSVDCFLEATDGDKVTAKVQDPFGDEMTAYYAILADKTAVIEMAVCAGLPLAEGRENPAITSTYGVGQLILDAAKRGCKKIIMCLGGSGTNDLGCGAAAAVGIKFFNEKGEEFIPAGGTLKDIKSVDLSDKDKLLDGIQFVTMCDIDNPLYGESGAAYVFAPQK
ncbi:MAG: glycerate kinase, partial [Clostridia bacterium]|nr:glycerate kinase [Clostridia bacterium]